MSEALKGTGFENDGSVECLKHRVTRFVNRGADVDALTEAWKKARKADRRASLNPLTPLGPIAKGMFGPELSSVTSSYQPPVGDGESVVPVAVIDTGITAELRTDGWLTRRAVRALTASTRSMLWVVTRSSTSVPDTARSRAGSSSRSPATWPTS